MSPQSQKTALVIGHPISHSKSPHIHNHWLKSARIDARYIALDVAPGNLADFIADLRAKNYIGANITLPHKQHIMRYCDATTLTAQQIGAVNTLYFDGKKLVGDNTDAYGFAANLDQFAPRWHKNLNQAIVLGAGGAARAIIGALLHRAAARIIILNRTVSNAQGLAQWFNKSNKISKVKAGTLEEFEKHAGQSDLLINTSSVGLNNTKFDNLDLAALPKHALVHDIVYTPLMTPLLADARRQGLKTVDGLGMLLHQAAPGFEKWFGVKPVVNDELRQIILSRL